jgi:CelD/BcsL family acetyltransferase involved in cellulose biosynthesis
MSSSSLPDQLSVDIYPAARWSDVRPAWATLAEASPYSSFFLLPEWVDCWLANCAEGLSVQVLVFRDESQPVGACLVTGKNVRLGGIPVRRIYLNAAGEDELDDTCIEYNNLLCLAGWEGPVARALASHLAAEKWDELVLNGFCDGPPLEAILAAFPECETAQNARPSYYVDLDAIRDSGSAYEDLLGQPTRKHLRQNYRHYAKLGELKTQTASSEEEALSMLDELAALHQDSWTRRGQPGAFSSATFNGFHRDLIRATFGQGGTQLFRISAGEVVGLIYAFVYRRKVYFYQSGLRYTDDKRLSPGQVANACAINRCLEAGWAEYDFLAGDTPYKKSLGTKLRSLTWVCLRRPHWKLRGIEVLRQIKAKLRSGETARAV